MNHLLTVDEKVCLVTLQLTGPVDVSGESVSEVTMVPPTADDILGTQANAPQNSREKNRQRNDVRIKRTLAKVCNLPLDTVGNLHGRDFNRLLNIFWAFTADE